jgi:hypothetical protein
VTHHGELVVVPGPGGMRDDDAQLRIPRRDLVDIGNRLAVLYLPAFIVRVDDGHGEEDLLNLIVEIKGYRREDAKEKKSTMDTYWVPGVSNLGTQGRWAFAEFTEVYQIEADFEAKVKSEFDKMIDSVSVKKE